MESSVEEDSRVLYLLRDGPLEAVATPPTTTQGHPGLAFTSQIRALCRHSNGLVRAHQAGPST